MIIVNEYFSVTVFNDHFFMTQSKVISFLYFYLFKINSQEECAAPVVVTIILKKWKRRSRQKICVKPFLSCRKECGIYNNLTQEPQHEDIDKYKRFLKMNPEVFDKFFSYIEIDITKQTAVSRELIPLKMKLAATLSYFSAGMSYSHLQHIFVFIELL